MNIEILARTYENGVVSSDNFDKFSYILGGRTGGTCYAKEGYFDTGIHDEARAMRIANRTSSSGHHSVFEHSHITLAITGIPKLLAMVLNSTNSYVTSEKSARYTVMNPHTELEKELYKKWFNRFKGLIIKEYPDKDIPVEKLAMENARYMTSVFTLTSMCYTVSYRQLCYIIGWLKELSNDTHNKTVHPIYKKLGESADELCKILEGQFVSEEYYIPAIKQKKFRFLATLNGKKADDIKEVLGEIYRVRYKASLACLAQLQRHRTLRYEMLFDGDISWYTPEIIRGTDFEEAWIKDLNTLYNNGIYPQALQVDIVESGLVEDFLMKAHERLCARVQLETMRNTMDTMLEFKRASRDNLLEKTTTEAVNSWVEFNTVKLKCKLCKCLEPCAWGPKGGRDRKV